MSVEVLLGKTLISVENINNVQLVFITDDGDAYELFHEQDCCESVTIDDIAGDLNVLIGSPLIISEEVSSEQSDGDWGGTQTWTFYKFATSKGYVTVRWYGESNGYYSESVDFKKINIC